MSTFGKEFLSLFFYRIVRNFPALLPEVLDSGASLSSARQRKQQQKHNSTRHQN